MEDVRPEFKPLDFKEGYKGLYLEIQDRLIRSNRIVCSAKGWRSDLETEIV